jgi:hypothetical protein
MAAFDRGEFKQWLKDRTTLSERAISDTASRANRGLQFLGKSNAGLESQLNALESCTEFTKLSMSVKSQIRKALRLYSEFSQN